MPSFTLRFEITGNTRDMQSLEAAKEMAKRQAQEILANLGLLPYWGHKPPSVSLSISVNNTSFRKMEFVEAVQDTVQDEEPPKENPFATME